MIRALTLPAQFIAMTAAVLWLFFSGIYLGVWVFCILLGLAALGDLAFLQGGIEEVRILAFCFVVYHGARPVFWLAKGAAQLLHPTWEYYGK